jgi:primosomal protein N'
MLVCACCGARKGSEDTCAHCGEASWVSVGPSAPEPELELVQPEPEQPVQPVKTYERRGKR